MQGSKVKRNLYFWLSDYITIAVSVELLEIWEMHIFVKSHAYTDI
jgi:hypothetical protein